MTESSSKERPIRGATGRRPLVVIAAALSLGGGMAAVAAGEEAADVIVDRLMETAYASGGPQDFCRCTCDYNGDGDCAFTDLLALLGCVGSTPGPGCPDLVCDGVIDERDVGAWECLFAGLPAETCCERLVPKWRQGPHESGEGFNVASNVDWQTLAQAPPFDPGPGPNLVVADDFRSDGRPITAVRWWGSYIDPRFEPRPNEEPPCTCDLDGDGDCTTEDLLQLLACVGSEPGPDCPDLNCDGVIDERDVEVWQCLADGGAPDECCPACTDDEIDGWLLSFHTNLPAEQNPDGFARPRSLIGLYFAPREAITITPTNLVGWDEHRVFEYRARLARTHLIHSYLDDRAGADPPDPAREGKFLETRDFLYWLDVQAVVGHTYRKRVVCADCRCDQNGDGACDVQDLFLILACFGDPACGGDVNCDGAVDIADVCAWECIFDGGPNAACCGEWVEVPTQNRADADFWGWHTSPFPLLANSTVGQLLMGNAGEWLYRNFRPVDGSPHGLDRVDQAYQLLTAFCPADIDGNGRVEFEDLLTVLAGWGRCECAPCLSDVTCDGTTDFEDILAVLSSWGPCVD